MGRDYQAIPELDRYDTRDIDEAEYEDMDAEQRAAAEKDLAKRDRRETRTGDARLPQALVDASEDDSDRPSKRARGDDPVLESDVQPLEKDLGELPPGVPIQEAVLEEQLRSRISRQFAQFLRFFSTERGRPDPNDPERELPGRPYYRGVIETMCKANKQSLEVSYAHLSRGAPIMAIWLADAPRPILEIFEEVAWKVVTHYFPNYESVHPHIYVRFTDLPIADKLRDLRHEHLNLFIRVSGVVVRRTGVFPQLKKVHYTCTQCASVIGPYIQSTFQDVKVSSCPECNGKGPFSLNQELTVYGNYQRLTLQESPGTVPPGRLPRQRDVILLGDLIDSAAPGEEIEVIGIYLHNYDIASGAGGFPVFSTSIEANHVLKKADKFSTYNLTTEERTEIQKLSKDPRLADRIFATVAPSIFGHEDIKTSLALSMFGGQEKNVEGRHRIRGDINVLLLGDPGVAKSQFLKYVEKTAPRAVFTTGKGASAVGLTASVRKDPVTREWTLEGGALVLADRGVCLIDEFDKMNDADRTSIHEAMEQQSISISKAGIVTTLQARCAVMAAANPIRGRYDPMRTFFENVDLTEPILSRFDILCVVKDTVDPAVDESLARFVVGSHMRSHPSSQDNTSVFDPPGAQIGFKDVDPIDQELFKKYIVYARQHVRPQLADVNDDKLTRLYAELRKESRKGGGISIAVRHIESIIRLAESHARMHLRESVEEYDVDMAIRITLQSFINSQKQSVMKQMERTFQKYLNFRKSDEDVLSSILLSLTRDSQRYNAALRKQGVSEEETSSIEVISLFRSLAYSKPKQIDCSEFELKAREKQVFDVHKFYEDSPLFESQYTYDRSRNVILKN
uniref:DNA replication licensing factor MCM2 n=1 Tax=Palpitomonas bilix TaxID=652834 RepID=A0A7S3D6T3_9EUKA